jgi:hypothetical protein
MSMLMNWRREQGFGLRLSAVALSLAMTAVVGAATGCGKGEEAPRSESGGLVIPERAGIFTEATQHYGPLTVSEGEFMAQADQRPWSSYWYPVNDDILVEGSRRNGGQATLDKYDRYSKGQFGKASTAVAEEKRKWLYNPRAANWEGRCGAWAIASVLEPEPVLPINGVKVPGSDVTFYTRDVKALLIKSYERVDNDAFRRFGQPYFGEAGEGSQNIEDIYPDQFHRVMQAELFERGRPFIMDDSASVEVWNTPVWQVITTITRDAGDPRVMHVFTRAKGTQSSLTTPDYASTHPVPPGGRQLVVDKVYEYTYDLYGISQADGSLLVQYGKWTGDSLKSHPDWVLSLPERGVKVKHASANEQLELSVIEDILAKTKAMGRFSSIFESFPF